MIMGSVADIALKLKKEDLNKLYKLMDDNNIEYEEGNAFYIALQEEANFRIAEIVEDLKDDKCFKHLVNTKGKRERLINKYTSLILDEFLQSDDIFNNDEIISITCDMYNYIVSKSKEKMKVYIVKGLYRMKADELANSIYEHLTSSMIIPFNKPLRKRIRRKCRKMLYRMFIKFQPDEKTCEEIANDVHTYYIRKLYHLKKRKTVYINKIN